MKKIKLEILGLSSSQSQTGSFALILGESSGNRRLPIVIGMFEAQAIAIEIEKISPNRPMTHDLFKSFATGFDIKIKEILISELKEGVFFAKILALSGKKIVEIDSRPSDAIAIGLRFNAEIFTTEAILSEAGIVLGDIEEEEVEDKETTKEVKKASAGNERKSKLDQLKDLTFDQLNKMLDDALSNEDYEKAAIVRDEINKRN